MIGAVSSRLTVTIGFSMNDTVIVFDRIREYFTMHTTKSKDQVINDAINSTLSRTVMTSFTTIIVVLVLFLFGGDSIRGFAFALLVGIGTGTYSSIFIAAPVLHDFASDFTIRKRESHSPDKLKAKDKKSFNTQISGNASRNKAYAKQVKYIRL